MMRQTAMDFADRASGGRTRRNVFGVASAGLAALVAAGCADPAPNETASDRAESATPDEVEILETVDAFFIAFAQGDIDAIEAMLTSEAITVALHPEDESRKPRRGQADALVAALRSGDFPAAVEPYWSPTVLQRGPLAVVWAPYEVSVDGKLLHCGIDVFTMSREDGAWKIDAISWTAEPSACDELRPEDTSVYRPKFPSGE